MPPPKRIPLSLRKPLIIAIDPGQNGGISWKLGELVQTKKLPKEDDYGTLPYFLQEIQGGTPRSLVRVFVEQQMPRPTFLFDRKTKKFYPTILKSTCILYGGYQYLLGVLTALDLEVTPVPPANWMKSLGMKQTKGENKSSWKNRLRDLALEYYPHLKVTLAVSDSLLLLHYATNLLGKK